MTQPPLMDSLLALTFILMIVWFWAKVFEYWSNQEEVEPPDGPGGHKHDVEEEWKEAA